MIVYQGRWYSLSIDYEYDLHRIGHDGDNKLLVTFNSLVNDERIRLTWPGIAACYDVYFHVV